MMRDDVWPTLKVLKKDMAWGEPKQMNWRLIHALDQFLSLNKLVFLVTCGTQGTHAPNSQHYTGDAVDIMFPNVKLAELPDVFMKALKFQFIMNGYDNARFKGLGIYNQWHWCGEVIGGMHFDWRPNNDDHVATWMRTEDGDLEVTLANFRKYFPGFPG